VGKGLELLKEMAPGVRRVALIFNPLTAPYYCVYLREHDSRAVRRELEEAAVDLGHMNEDIRRMLERAKWTH
jgi:putative ABC transport system substrate-binding protein